MGLGWRRISLSSDRNSRNTSDRNAKTMLGHDFAGHFVTLFAIALLTPVLTIANHRLQIDENTYGMFYLSKFPVIGPSSISLNTNNRIVLLSDASTRRPKPNDWALFYLLGKKFSFDANIASAGCGCNAALYLVSMGGQPGYCDANFVGGTVHSFPSCSHHTNFSCNTQTQVDGVRKWISSRATLMLFVFHLIVAVQTHAQVRLVNSASTRQAHRILSVTDGGVVLAMVETA